MPGQLDLCNGPRPGGRCERAHESRQRVEGVASTTWRGIRLSILGLLDCHSPRHSAHDRVRRDAPPFFLRGCTDASGTGVRDVGSVPPAAEPLRVAGFRMAVLAPLDTKYRKTKGGNPPWFVLVSSDGCDRPFRLGIGSPPMAHDIRTVLRRLSAVDQPHLPGDLHQSEPGRASCTGY